MLFYRLFTWLYPKMAFLLGFWNRKARLWHEGRKGLLKKMEIALQENIKPVIWVHCASLGEFEQGLPVLEALRKQYPGHLVFLTFFSPSGYEIRKEHPAADLVFYLPMDTPSNAISFFNIVKPSIVIFIKYEFWYYYLQEAHHRKIPLLLVSAVFRKTQSFFRWYGGLHRKMLGFFTCLFVQDNNSLSLLMSADAGGRVFVCGDTRFDRVIRIAAGFEPIAAITQFCEGKTTLVAGSTWTDDDEELDHFANTHPDLQFIIVPHEIEEERLKECLTLYHNAMLYSDYIRVLEAGLAIPEDIHVLIVDNVGMLSRLYKYASVCYVGGGFGDDGIHNILEAAVYGKPVIFGPVYENYIEAVDLVDKEAAFSVEDALELEQVLNELLNDEGKRSIAGHIAKEYIAEKSGATQKVMNYISENGFLGR